MYKFLTKTILIIFLTFSPSYGEIIENVEVSGNKRISKETIIVLGQINLNQDFSSVDLNNILKKLYDTNFFGNVTLSIDKGILQIKVIENPIIEDIDDIPDAFELFWNQEQILAFENLVKEENLKSNELQKVIDAYVFTSKKPMRDHIINAMQERPSLRERAKKANRLTELIIDFVETFLTDKF